MSHLASTWAWAQDVTNAKHKLLLVKLADSANDDGVCWPSLRTLSKHTGISKSALGRIARALEEAGLLRIQETLKADGSRGVHVYHLALAEVSHSGGTPPLSHPKRDGVSHPGRDADEPSGNRQGESKPGTALAAPVHLGQRRWQVPSSRKPEGFEVDLGRVPVLKDGSLPVAATAGANGLTCTCENRAATVCRHQKAAALAESRAEKVRLRALRDAVWDALVESFGKPAAKQKDGFGSVRNVIVERLMDEGVEQQPEVWKRQVATRYAALAQEWGVGRVTLHAFGQNWNLAGKLLGGLSNDRPNGNNTGNGGEDPYARGAIRADE